VRGICCLKPGVAGVSENIRVVSTIGRFLEHSRAYYFSNATCPLYCSSADWMERNLQHRIEVAFPILKKKWINRIIDEMEMHLTDRRQTWELQSDGTYLRPDVDGLDEVGDGVQNQLLNSLSIHATVNRR
ncbi:MAG TPA: RNA degradosome polyphosphate kinase, partial [Pseudohongiella sp.]|nr:RNA degradosome polyphosphate kinase [Pseudohongiella sp.]